MQKSVVQKIDEQKVVEKIPQAVSQKSVTEKIPGAIEAREQGMI